MAEKNTRYYHDVAVIKRKDQTLSCESNLDVGLEIASPLMLHQNWSRFGVTIIDKRQGETLTLKGNIPVNDIYYIEKIMDILLAKKFDKPAATDKRLPACYTKKFTFGNGLVGKTPIQLLTENEQSRNLLVQQRDYLLNNADKYPANREWVEIINESINLYNAGQIDWEYLNTQSISETYTVYDKQYKHLKTNSLPNGKCFVYSISIFLHTGKKYPWEIKIDNCYAPVEQDNRIVFSQAEGHKSSSMNLSDEEFVYTVNRLTKTTQYFENSIFGYQYQKVKSNDAKVYNG